MPVGGLVFSRIAVVYCVEKDRPHAELTARYLDLFGIQNKIVSEALDDQTLARSTAFIYLISAASLRDASFAGAVDRMTHHKLVRDKHYVVIGLIVSNEDGLSQAARDRFAVPNSGAVAEAYDHQLIRHAIRVAF